MVEYPLAMVTHVAWYLVELEVVLVEEEEEEYCGPGRRAHQRKRQGRGSGGRIGEEEVVEVELCFAKTQQGRSRT